jgi:hypothetical protein
MYCFYLHRTDTGLRMWEYCFVNIALCDVPGFSFAGKTQDLCIFDYSCIHTFYKRVSLHRTDTLPTYVRIFFCRYAGINVSVFKFVGQTQDLEYENILVAVFMMWRSVFTFIGQTQDLVCELLLLTIFGMWRSVFTIIGQTKNIVFENILVSKAGCAV